MNTEIKIVEILNDLAKLIEKLPNVQELGGIVRNEYWSKLKQIK